MKCEIYNSWTFFSEVKCTKKIDKSFIKHAETGIPQGMRAFFGIEDLKALFEANQKIILSCNGESIPATILVAHKHTSSPRTKMTFTKRLFALLAIEEATLLNKEISFEKVAPNHYKVYVEQIPKLESLPEIVTNCDCDLCGFDFSKIYPKEKNSNFYQLAVQEDGIQYSVCPNCATILKINNLQPLQLKERIEEMENEEIWQLLDDTKVFI
ncbi:MAG: hypothetical protein ACRC17_00620 [Culicoidibacterales bacterium]